MRINCTDPARPHTHGLCTELGRVGGGELNAGRDDGGGGRESQRTEGIVAKDWCLAMFWIKIRSPHPDPQVFGLPDPEPLVRGKMVRKPLISTIL